MSDIKNLEIKTYYQSRITYAMHENNVPVIERINILNYSDDDLPAGTLTCEANPPVFSKVTIDIPPIGSKRSVDTGEIDSLINTDYILSLSSAVSGVIKVTYRSGETEVTEEYRTETESFDMWPGALNSPELTAAFSIPRYSLADTLINRSQDILKNLTGNPSIKGYKDSDNQRIREIFSSVFTSVKELNIRQTVLPQKYHEDGLNIRLSDEIDEKRMANELDMALLLSSVLERCGLNPVVILNEDKVFSGVWLKDETLPETVSYDLTQVTKRSAEGVNSLTVIDPASLFSGNTDDFNAAQKRADLTLRETDKFICTIDIKRARYEGIKPLPVRIKADGKFSLEQSQDTEVQEAVLPEERTTIDVDGNIDEKLPKAKVWERKLLDLSLRNNLLNFRRNRSSFEMFSPGMNAVLSYLKSGKALKIMSYQGTRDEENLSYEEIRLKQSNLAESELKSGRVRVPQSYEDLYNKARKLRRGYQQSLSDTGSNNLFVSLGLLKWFEKGDRKNERLAPLVLIPVDITERVMGDGFNIKLRDEDAVFNITLLEFLYQEFGIKIAGLDPLPLNGEDIDLVKVMTLVRKAVMGELRWDILEEVHIGLFSFNKFIMWHDIKENIDVFSKNKIVSSLMEGKLTFTPETMEHEGEVLDDIYHPKDILYPVSSDTSQSLAVMASVEGKSFVLHGPPGTGKSQTITNIIANALYKGKRVLFVAQKMAALEVVKKRLEDTGIGSFCLEIHSDKAKKTEVLSQLERSLRIAGVKKGDDYEKISEDIKKSRDELNNLWEILYRKDETGYSIYDLIDKKSRTEEYGKYLDLPDDFDFKGAKGKTDLIMKMVNLGNFAKGPYRNPLSGIERCDYSPTLKEDVLNGREIPWSELSDAFRSLKEKTGLDPVNSEELRTALEFLNTSADLSERFPELKVGDDLRKDSENLVKASELTAKINDIREHIRTKYSDKVNSLKSAELDNEFKGGESRNPLAKLFSKNPGISRVISLTDNKNINNDDIAEIISALKSAEDKEHEKAELLNRELPGYLRAAGNNDGEALQNISILTEKTLSLENSGIKDITEKSPSEIVRISANAEFKDDLKNFNDRFEPIRDKVLNYLDTICFDKSRISDMEETDIFDSLSQAMPLYEESIDSLKDWVNFKEAEKEAVDAGLKQFTQGYSQGKFEGSELSDVFSKSVVRSMLNRRLSEVPELLSLTGRTIDEKVKSLKKKLSDFELLQRKVLYQSLANRIPELITDKKFSGQISTLQRAIRSGGRDLSIRDLLKDTDEALKILTPCMLMSPMSVAQFLKADENMFDMVIFDEASQLPTADAVGSLGRGREAIIVGDPKQLPPTSFFMTTTFDEENSEFEDLNNILEDALALNMPQMYLIWHYRSRHESLIAFSNREFYDGKLYTYPSPDDMISKVTLRKNDGIYDRGGKKVNPTEAQEIVDEIKKRADMGKTIGVVTFSQVQQSLIEDLLDKAMDEDPEFQKKLDAMAEPVFVRNLENVQGDERDVILFSVGYGKDKDGKVSLNFGPLNQEGGWRRLNVALTRSKSEMVIFTNLDPSDLKVSKLSARGAVELKNFLEYAGRGERAAAVSSATGRNENENLNVTISEMLRERGYRVRNTIGASKFKVDLAIEDTEEKGRYILGLMCGGDSYQNTRAVYDREILQKSVLEGLGWNIKYIFPVDWYENRMKVLDSIEQEIQEIRLKKKKGQEVKPADDNITENTESDEPGAFRYYTLNTVKPKNLTTDEFFDVTNAPSIREDLINIINVEGPIMLELLSKRIRNVYNLPRLTERTIKQTEMILNGTDVTKVKVNGSYFYMQSGRKPEDMDIYRKTLPEDKDRKFTDIIKEEILVAVKEILTEPKSERSIIREVTDLFGYPVLSQETESYIKNILDVAVLDGILIKDQKGMLEVKHQSM